MNKSKVIVELSISLDGFIACLDDEVGPLFDWYSSGDNDLHLLSTNSEQSRFPSR